MKNTDKVLYKYQPEFSGKKVIYVTIKSADRNATRDEVESALTKDKIKYERVEVSKSGFYATQFFHEGVKTNIVYKPLRGGGSGAGAAVTKIGESAQCMYASVAFNVKKKKITDKDITVDILKQSLKWAKTDEDTQKLLHKVPDDWIHSAIIGANTLKAEFNGAYEFHRGSPTVDKIENTLKKINRQEGAFGNLNKWSPADIYMVHNSFDVSIVENATTLHELNKIMHDQLKKKKLIGVSLKKIETDKGKLSYKNLPKAEKPDYKYKGISTTVDSIDSYILTSHGKMQFRSFGGTKLTGWQGEGKGQYANQGKISLGPINYIFKVNKITQLATNSATLARQNTKAHATKISRLIKKHATGQTRHATPDWVMRQTEQWRYSKYLSLSVIEIVSSISPMAKRNRVITQLFLYSASQTDFSAPYAKLE